MKKLIETMLMVSVLCLFGCSSDPDVEPLKRDTDDVNVAYKTDATSQFTVRFNGPWTASVVCMDEAGEVVDNWFTVSPDKSIGNGSDYEWVTVTAQRNAGAARIGYVILHGGNNTTEQKITIKQEDGIFAVTKPVIKGVIKSGVPSVGELVVEYDKAYGGEEITISAVLSGASDGLTIRDDFTTTVGDEGSGSFSIPITGTPLFLGALMCDVVVTLNGNVIFDEQVSSDVVSSNEILRMGFEKFVWGGDYLNNKAGVGPNGTSGADKTFMGNEPVNGAISAGSDGTSDVFNTMTATFRINRGVEAWGGQRVYEHPNYVKLGVTAQSGWIRTPELEGLTSAPETVVFSVDLCRFDNENATYIVSAEGAGVVLNGTITSSVLPAPTKASERKWTTLTFTVEGATNKTKLKISGEDLGSGVGGRLNVDNIVVMGAAKVEVKEQLPAPDVTKISYMSDDNSISYKWEGVKGATGYKASVAMRGAEDFRKSIEIEGTECLFESLIPGFYEFTVQALYAENPKFNSEESKFMSGTAGYVDSKLSTPTNLKCTPTTSTVTVTWDVVVGATGYKVEIIDGATTISSKEVEEVTCAFDKLTQGHDYKITVKALNAISPEFESDEASITFKTLDPVPMTPPVLRVYAKTHGLTVIEWELSDKALAEQPVGSKDTYDFQVKDATGNVVRSIEKFEKFNFTKYKNFRLVWGGLTPGAKYTMEIRRKSVANKSSYLDSEWVAVDVTTDAAPDISGYLLYKDFDNYPCGAQPLYGAYGFSFGSTVDFSNPDEVLLAAGDANSVYTQGVKITESYFSAYLPEWDMTDWPSTSSNIGIGAGYMKFGGGTNPAWMTLPKFAALTAPTDIYLELDSCPYLEPSSAGDMMSPSNADLIEYFYVAVSDGGVIAEVTGETSASAVIDTDNTRAKLRNVMVEKMKEEGLTTIYRFTSHKIKITGATADTRIKIYTALEKIPSQNFRMWVDNIKVKTAN